MWRLTWLHWFSNTSRKSSEQKYSFGIGIPHCLIIISLNSSSSSSSFSSSSPLVTWLAALYDHTIFLRITLKYGSFEHCSCRRYTTSVQLYTAFSFLHPVKLRAVPSIGCSPEVTWCSSCTLRSSSVLIPFQMVASASFSSTFAFGAVILWP